MKNGIFVAARVDEVNRDSGDWVFVDIGFAQRGNRSCGFAFNDGDPSEVEFGNLATTIIDAMSEGSGPFHLLIEAPLSAAFDAEGNPTGRRIERRDSDHRYWYESSGCRTLVAATYLLRQLLCRLSARDFKGQVRLVEGIPLLQERAVFSCRRCKEAQEYCVETGWVGRPHRSTK